MQAYLAFQQSKAYEVAVQLNTSCIKAGQGKPVWGIRSKSQRDQKKQLLVPFLGDPKIDRDTQMSYIWREFMSVPCRFPGCLVVGSDSRFCRILWTWLFIYVGFFFFVMSLKLMAPTIFFFLQEDSPSLACLTVGLCTFFHQLWDEGSLTINGVVTNLS